MNNKKSEKPACIIVFSFSLFFIGLAIFFLLSSTNKKAEESIREPTTAVVTIAHSGQNEKIINKNRYKPLDMDSIKKNSEEKQRIFFTGTAKTVYTFENGLYLDIEADNNKKGETISVRYSGDDIPDIKENDTVTVYGVSFGTVSMYERNYKVREHLSVFGEYIEKDIQKGENNE